MRGSAGWVLIWAILFGAAGSIAEFFTPWFLKKPAGGCDPETGASCVEGAIQVSLGELAVTCDGRLSFTGRSYFENYSGVPWTVESDPDGPRLVANAWNYVELKLVLAGVNAKGVAQPCGLDPDPDPYGLITARINGTECLRHTAAEGPYTYAVFVPCGCFLCQYFPVGVGEVLLYSNPYGDHQTHLDDFVLATWDMLEGEDAWMGDLQTLLMPAAGAGSSAQFTPVGAATNWQAAAANDGASSYNRTNQTAKRDSARIINLTAGIGIVCGERSDSVRVARVSVARGCDRDKSVAMPRKAVLCRATQGEAGEGRVYRQGGGGRAKWPMSVMVF